MHISFIPAVEGDAADLVQVQIAAFHHDSQIYPGVAVGGPPGYDSVSEVQRKISEDICYTMRDSGRCIGGIVIFAIAPDYNHLDLIFLDPAYHNRGIGTRAMHFIEQAHPAARWTLDTPQWALRNHHFYEKLGYVQVDAFEHDGTPLFAYEKRFPAVAIGDTAQGH